MDRTRYASQHARELHDYAKANGWCMSTTRNNHLQFKRDGCATVFASLTPSCPRATKKAIAKMKRSEKESAPCDQ